MRFCVRKRAGIWAGLIVVSGLLMGQPALATPLGLDLLPLGPEADPDIFADFGSVTYTAATDALVITLRPVSIFTAGSLEAIIAVLGDFTLSATIDGSGVMTSGTFTILGSVAGLGFGGPTPLTGTLRDFASRRARAPPGSPAGIVGEPRRGRVYVADRGGRRLLVSDRDGAVGQQYRHPDFFDLRGLALSATGDRLHVLTGAGIAAFDPLIEP